MRGKTIVALVLALGTARGSLAQPERPLPERSVEGRVVVMSRDSLETIPGTWVTLHRVADDRAGPLDSVRTDARGRFALRYRPFGSPDAIYFASTRFGGVAYFTRPLKSERVTGDDAEIQVFDTTTAPVPTTIRGRHVIVSAPDAKGARTVIEVYEISNDTTVTRLDRDERAGDGSWSAPVAAGATHFAVQAGEIPEDALVHVNDRAVLHMPLAPGLKQIAFSYTLDADRFPLALVPERSTSVFEVLVEEPRGTVQGAPLAPVEPVVVEGRSFRRFLGSDVPARTRITVDVPSPSPAWTRWVLPTLLVAIGVAMLGALVRPRRRRPVAAAVGRSPTPDAMALDEPAAELARRIAALDDAFQRDATPSPDARDAYERERAELKARLASTLAGERTAR